ncbi:MAG: VOC family protein [Ignavibacteriae bacterium]|nr:VOC family protein [Ignavibacteriota bacterium]
MKNALNWFEIPATDFDRAVKFYNGILDAELYCTEMNGYKMGFFPMDQNDTSAVGGAVVTGEFYTPSTDGAVVYLNAGENLSTVLDRVEPNGGKILMPKTLITEEIGYMAFFLDSEGGKIALHSSK